MNESGLHTIGGWVRDRARASADRIAVDDRGVVLSYRDLDERSSALADAFRAAGYVVGDRVATLTGNSSDHVVVFFACARAGLVLVPLSWRLSPRELATQLAVADPTLLLVEDECETLAGDATARLAAAALPTALPSTLPRTMLGARGVESRVPAPRRADATDEPGHVGRARSVQDDDALLLVFTSGTLGQPKGVVLTHANCFWTNLSLAAMVELTSADVVLSVMPQYHVGGWNIQPLLAWNVGATVVLERTFDPGRVLQLIQDRRISTMMGVPANYLFLAQHPLFAGADLSSLKHALVGGAPMPAPLLRTWHARGVALTQGYGLTEASPNVLYLPDEDARSMVGYAGKPYPHVQVAVADPLTGEHLTGAGFGELLVRGPNVFSGYFRAPAETAAALRDGWLHTGDLVRRDDRGYYAIVDRISEIYTSGGESIAPAEVENVVFEHAAVADVAVIGVPDDRWGEVGVAFVVLRPGHPAEQQAIDEQQILAHTRAELARFKVPAFVRFLPELPRSHSGKVQRRELLARWQRASVSGSPVSGSAVSTGTGSAS
ncbi:long-chain fatty acid--CoA ligase [Cryobacterium frigoriphilum]|uniref:Long-chain fatty acid--CoA ligase n=1 Tax=Cryobacterium frigoriphilum TaxID=1259150 RepID=A0A4V3IQW7_9MICO|nr:AMP-binding protein [Cryobacterium frigoriphilum]TFD48864.1 long-chain fatty acid--CoA ligase [Cryobacterium frigoriphilum]